MMESMIETERDGESKRQDRLIINGQIEENAQME
jgi:hypothetical protein